MEFEAFIHTCIIKSSNEVDVAGRSGPAGPDPTECGAPVRQAAARDPGDRALVLPAALRLSLPPPVGEWVT